MSPTRFWVVSTRALPIMVQPVLGVLLTAMWLLGKAGIRNDTFEGLRTTLLLAAGITILVSLTVAGVLFTRKSPTARGVGLSAAASAAVVAIGAVTYAVWLF
ncbi:hypothetical protein ACTXG7_27540 [Mycolicibacterium sp. Dal123E01]|uniref:hypothetical protein n=1 Tax=Mycolicibacterium sp. Dal123E01 TaxID=3457578 RepID=UPI00403EE0B1